MQAHAAAWVHAHVCMQATKQAPTHKLPQCGGGAGRGCQVAAAMAGCEGLHQARLINDLLRPLVAILVALEEGARIESAPATSLYCC